MPDTGTFPGGKAVLLLADLHLPPEPSALGATFEAFLAGAARRARAVYLLGDLFDIWIGDDVGLDNYPRACAALRNLTAVGVAVYFMHGNRDFMVGRHFSKATGVKILGDPTPVELPDGPVLLSHGDIMCTDDRRYQRYRRIVNWPVLQRLFMLLPVSARRMIGDRIRASSKVRRQRIGTSTISDVNEQAVRQLLISTGQTRLIHGHTHRPAQHRVELAGQSACRWVLADWRATRMEYMACDAFGWHRVLLPPQRASD